MDKNKNGLIKGRFLLRRYIMSEELDKDNIEKMAREINEIEKALLEKDTYFSKERIFIAINSLSLAKIVIERVLEEKPSYNCLNLNEVEEFIFNSLCSMGCKIISYKKENFHRLVANCNKISDRI